MIVYRLLVPLVVGGIVGYVMWTTRKGQGIGLQGSLFAGAVGAGAGIFTLEFFGIFIPGLLGLIVASILCAVLWLLVSGYIAKRQDIKPATSISTELANKEISQESASPHQKVAASERSIPEQIEQLAKLKAQGILSEAEFEEKKKDMLSRL